MASADHAISTHILDTVTGQPARDVPVRLDGVAEGRTDGDGRLRFPCVTAGRHRLVFDVTAYLGEDCFFPEVTVVFRVGREDRSYHVPLLLSRYGYTTYRGS
jgi:5-hydroxyisourate hydrolase